MCFRAVLISAATVVLLLGAARADAPMDGRIAAVGPLLDTILALAPAPGETFSVAEGRRRTPMVRWGRYSIANSAKGRLGDVRVRLAGGAAPGAEFLSIRDDAANALAPALEARGIVAAEIACLDYGPVVTVQVFRVTAPGKAPFVLTVHDWQHRPGSLPPEYAVVADFSGRPARFEDHIDDRPGWKPSCG